MNTFALRVQCRSTRGIVAAISTFLAAQGCNITDAVQFDDDATGNFFARISFRSEDGVTLDELRAQFAPVGAPFDMQAEFFDEAVKRKVVIMVSRFGHCLNDLLYRWRIGALPIDIVAVISNHLDYQKVVVNHDIGFHQGHGAEQARGRGADHAGGGGQRGRADRAGALHAGPVG